jgi:arylsulfatase A-like enzyme
MSNEFTRREFIKLSGLASLSVGAGYLHGISSIKAEPESPNIFIFLFDTFSANHLSFLGYPRATTPNLEKRLDKFTIYHSHHASAPYTTPATSSLLTGSHVWRHGALQLGATVTKGFENQQIFNLLRGLGYDTIAYTHNPVADILLKQMNRDIATYKPREDLFLNLSPLLTRLANRDFNTALQANERLFNFELGQPHSLLLSQILRNFKDLEPAIVREHEPQFPRGLPGLQGQDSFFILEHAIDWIGDTLSSIDRPTFGYFHLLPPHYPYAAREEFVNRFRRDGYTPPPKPEHIFNHNWTQEKLDERRRDYDEFIVYTDSELNRLLNKLDEAGIFENSWIIITSDHGDLFERGIWGHTNMSLHHPVIHIPLLIHAPGQSSRKDILSPTSALDVLPTLLAAQNSDIPDWAEGRILPPFDNGSRDLSDPVFSFNPRRNNFGEPIDPKVATITRDSIKLIYWSGLEELEGEDLIEMYNLQDDPEELNDLAKSDPEASALLLDELKSKINEYDQFFE